MKLSRRQIRDLIMEEINSSRSVSTRNSRQLNEGLGTAIAAVAIGVPLLAYAGIQMVFGNEPNYYEDAEGNIIPVEPTISNRQAYARYEEMMYPNVEMAVKTDASLKRAAEEVGQRVLNGEDGVQAAKSVIQSDSAVAQTLKDCCVDPGFPMGRSQTGLGDISGMAF